ncbi:hypothetical protein N7G274_002420 [Stereocaulon virgatum]|uniref:Cytochrome P450 n=1 Tax=Stereocaulon virgatum TaxID=373712 RepID=A0ABR4AHT6_9LECA
MNAILFLVLLILIVISYAISGIVEARHDAREPPALPSKIPLIGHVIGLLQKKARYYAQLRHQQGAQIYSLAMPEGTKLYVVTSTKLIDAVQRQPKTLAFPPVGVKFAMSLAGSSKEANNIATDNINGEDGDYGLSMDFNKVVYPALSPGKSLEAMYSIIIPRIAASLDGLKAENSKGITIGLTQWVRHELTVTITDCVYGLGNPFRERAVEDAFWDFENDLFRIMMNLLPSVSARKGIQGRELITNAFLRYFQSGALATGSVFAQSRYANAAKHNVPLVDIARFETVTLIGTLTSTIRTVIWMLYHIYSNPSILSDCREEVPKIMTAFPMSEKNRTLQSLDITALKSNCPILGSTFQEVLRHHALGTSVRQVMHDTLLENRYLLKKGGMVLMPSVVVHSDPSLWGPSVNEFNHRRFLRPSPSANGTTSKKQQHRTPPPSAFRAFGGGTTLCPGRHFATTVTMAVTIMFVMRYELRPLEQGGRWPHITAHKTHAVAAVEQPDQEIELEVTGREGFENSDWMFRLEGSEPMLTTVAEDLA